MHLEIIPVTNSHSLGVKSLHFQTPGDHIGGYISILFPLWSVINPHLREKSVQKKTVFTIIFPSISHECLNCPSIFTIMFPSFCHQYHMFLLYAHECPFSNPGRALDFVMSRLGVELVPVDVATCLAGCLFPVDLSINMLGWFFIGSTRLVYY